VKCAKCGKEAEMPDIHVLPDGWERSMGDDYCGECMTPMLAALAILSSKESNKMTREQALPYVAYCVDDALSEREIKDMPDNARLVGWQCGFEPMFVAVWSYLDLDLDDDEAEQLAVELLIERKWFADKPTSADYII
jgi:hypothetical protein